jgi:molybdopterin adenylyltransferase
LNFTAAVITVSDSGSRGERPDSAGDAIEQLLTATGAASVARALVPDERDEIAVALRRFSGDDRVDLILTTGGTGLAPRDVTPEATLEVIDRQAPGFAEAIRSRSLEITPRAILSRALCGIRGTTLIINLPGSRKAASEAFAVIQPALDHAIELLTGNSGDCARG